MPFKVYYVTFGFLNFSIIGKKKQHATSDTHLCICTYSHT